MGEKEGISRILAAVVMGVLASALWLENASSATPPWLFDKTVIAAVDNWVGTDGLTPAEAIRIERSAKAQARVIAARS